MMSKTNTSKTNLSSTSKKTLVGSFDNFWLFERQVSDITIDAAKTALLIIDLPNFPLSPAPRKDLPPEMFEAEKLILNYGIPAARKAEIQIIWLNWYLTDENPPITASTTTPGVSLEQQAPR